ncbi:exosortase/archaeosortase family protein [Akkermansiaceae bacterium]|nr:exosortase/archaeosortase family protein [bacterium]MDA8968749.1 exosortase/archaeosortase family protein [Akkermansiaceae bacterium]
MRLSEISSLPRRSHLLLAISLGVLLFFYFFYNAYPTAGGSLAVWAWQACNSINGFLHGRFIPLAFAIMCWLGWKRAKTEEVSPRNLGLAVLALGLLFYVVSVRTIQPRIAIIGVPFIVIGTLYYLFGAKVTRHFVFPAFFWWFAMPVPGLEAALTGRLQVLVTESCFHAGQFVGMDLVRQGSTITMASAGGESMDIAEGCSGIRSLMALTMIAAVYANYTQKSLWKKAVLFASSLPLAIIGNFGRIFTILIIAQMGYADFAMKTYHDWAGLLLFFPIALSGLYLVDYLLNLKSRRRRKKKVSVSRKVTAPIEG